MRTSLAPLEQTRVAAHALHIGFDLQKFSRFQAHLRVSADESGHLSLEGVDMVSDGQVHIGQSTRHQVVAARLGENLLDVSEEFVASGNDAVLVKLVLVTLDEAGHHLVERHDLVAIVAKQLGIGVHNGLLDVPLAGQPKLPREETIDGFGLGDDNPVNFEQGDLAELSF